MPNTGHNGDEAGEEDCSTSTTNLVEERGDPTAKDQTAEVWRALCESAENSVKEREGTYVDKALFPGVGNIKIDEVESAHVSTASVDWRKEMGLTVARR